MREAWTVWTVADDMSSTNVRIMRVLLRFHVGNKHEGIGIATETAREMRPYDRHTTDATGIPFSVLSELIESVEFNADEREQIRQILNEQEQREQGEQKWTS